MVVLIIPVLILIILILIVLILILIVLPVLLLLLLVLEHLLRIGQIALGIHIARIAPQRLLEGLYRLAPAALLQVDVTAVVKGIGGSRAARKAVQRFAGIFFRLLPVFYLVEGVCQVVLRRNAGGVLHQRLLVVDLGGSIVRLLVVAVAAAHLPPVGLRLCIQAAEHRGHNHYQYPFHSLNSLIVFP